MVFPDAGRLLRAAEGSRLPRRTHCADPPPGDIVNWLETFAQSFFHGFSDAERSEYLQEVRADVEPHLRDDTGTWVADYVRLRFAAIKSSST